MNIGIFTYNFPHWKTQEGLHNLFLHGYKPQVILAANPVKLNFYQSKIRIAPKDLFLQHPIDLAKRYDIDYHVVEHNSERTANIVKQYNLDLGIILGARILKPIAFENFNIGVLNMHPGILPENRGLDNVKWAIINGHAQGVTTHLIDSKIDRGVMIEQETIDIYHDDTVMDMHIRIQHLEQKLMISSIEKVKNGKMGNKLEQGNYYKSVPEDIEQTLLTKLKQYKNEI
jgi:phosphoribosylglycinamide formyltransferase-1